MNEVIIHLHWLQSQDTNIVCENSYLKLFGNRQLTYVHNNQPYQYFYNTQSNKQNTKKSAAENCTDIHTHTNTLLAIHATDKTIAENAQNVSRMFLSAVVSYSTIGLFSLNKHNKSTTAKPVLLSSI